MRTYIRQYAQRHTDDGGVAGTHAVHTVVEVGAVAHRCHHDDSHYHEQYPACRNAVLAENARNARVVEVMALDERDGCLQRLVRFALMLHYYLLTLTLVNEVLVHLDVWRRPQHKTHYQTDTHLTYYLVATLQAFLVVAEYLYEVVHAAQHTEPQRGDNHQYEVDVAQASEQKHRNKDGDDDDDAAHRRHSYLLHTERVDACVARSLSNLLALEILDKLLAEPCRDNERQYQRQQRTERNVAPHVRATNAVFFEETKKII